MASGEFCRTIISWRVVSFAGRLSRGEWGVLQDDYLVATGEFCRTIISWRVESFAGRLSSDGMQPLVFFNVELVNY